MMCGNCSRGLILGFITSSAPSVFSATSLMKMAKSSEKKARLVAQGYTQIEGVDFGETFAHVARLESIRIMLAFSKHHNIKLYQMDVKSAFPNGNIEEEVYVAQPPGFENSKNPDMVYKLKKELYSLKQA